MDIIVTGATGGIGHCLIQQAISNPNIEKIYCQYRNKEKFQLFFDKSHPKIIAERQEEIYPQKESYILQELYKNKPKNIACVYTAFTITPIKKVGTYLPEEIKENINTNIWNTVFFINQLVQFMKDCKVQLRIINIDSGAAYKPLEGWGMYSASKAYVNIFLKTVQLENPNIKIVSYEPGVVDTPMQKEIRKADESVFRQVNEFREYYKKKILRDPELIAKDILKRFIEGWDGIDFREKYKD